MQAVIDALEAERADLQERVAWLDGQIKEFRERHGDERSTPALRSVRRAIARRASTHRATARQRKGDTAERIIEYLKDHPEHRRRRGQGLERQPQHDRHAAVPE
jgi:hypothetical protein